jgi:HEPN domain-containing protein
MVRNGARRTKRTVYEETSRRMLRDARFLLRHKRWHSAVYLAGYTVECRLKAAICQFLNQRTLPTEFRTHNLWTLLMGAGLDGDLVANPQMRSYFSYMESQWDVEIRYAGKTYGRNDAEKFLDSVGRFVKWLDTILSEKI